MSLALALWLTLAPATLPPVPPVLQAAPKPKPAVPLAVTRVERKGTPPFGDKERLYRIEGDGVDRLLPGDILQLHRKAGDLIMPRLEVAEAMPDHALARVFFPGETFPMVGDVAWPRGVAEALPVLPGLLDATVAADPKALQPAAPASKPPAPLGAPPRREPLYYLQGESRITPAGLAKVRAWVKAWGAGSCWFLACPPWPGESLDLRSARLSVLQEELKRLGIPKPDLRILMEPAAGKYPLVFLGTEPW